MTPIFHGEFQYTPRFSSKAAKCYLIVVKAPEPVWVDNEFLIHFIELPDNPGMSVTNACEALAQQITDRFGVNPKESLWVESNPPGSYCKVTFDQVPGDQFAQAKWEPMDDLGRRSILVIYKLCSLNLPPIAWL